MISVSRIVNKLVNENEENVIIGKLVASFFFYILIIVSRDAKLYCLQIYAECVSIFEILKKM